jgi:hypothetical protein
MLLNDLPYTLCDATMMPDAGPAGPIKQHFNNPDPTEEQLSFFRNNLTVFSLNPKDILTNPPDPAMTYSRATPRASLTPLVA